GGSRGAWRSGGCGQSRSHVPESLHGALLPLRLAGGSQTGRQKEGAPLEVIVDNGPVVQAEPRVRPAEGIGRRGGQTLDRPSQSVAEIADGPSGERKTGSDPLHRA